MRISDQNHADAISMIKAAKPCLLSALFVAGVLALWSPFYPKFFANAVAQGILAGCITLFGWTRKTHIFLFQVLRFSIPGTGLMISKDFLVPDKLPLGSILLMMWQSFAVLCSAQMAAIVHGV